MITRIIDCHCHLGSYFNFYVPAPSPDDMVRSMDNLGIEKACLSPHICLSSDIVAGNNEMLAAVNSHPERLLGYFTYNPHYPNLMQSELDRCFKNPNVMGIKIHQGTHETCLTNPGYEYCYKFANSKRLPVLIHTWSPQTISNIERLSLEYPKAIFIMGHFGGSDENMLQAAKVINSRENVYGDTTISSLREGNIEWLIEISSDDRLMFGTDMPFMDPRPGLGRILSASISQVSREKVLSANFMKILKNTL